MNAFIEKWANLPPGKLAPPGEPIKIEPAPPSPDSCDDSESTKTEVQAAPAGVPSGKPGPRTPEVEQEPSTLKGQAVELWRDGRRFFLVADDADALEAMRRFGAHRGEVWTSGELELVASIPDQAMRDEVESFKRQMDGSLAPGTAGRSISAAEWQAQMLNKLFQEQGVTGQPGKITAATVRHGERGGHK